MSPASQPQPASAAVPPATPAVPAAPLLNEDVLSNWLDAQCRMLPGVVTALATFSLDTDGRPLRPITWPDDVAPETALLDVAAMACQRQVPVASQSKQDSSPGTVTLSVGLALTRARVIAGSAGLGERARVAVGKGVVAHHALDARDAVSRKERAGTGKERRAGLPSLVIAPTSVVVNWPSGRSTSL